MEGYGWQNPIPVTDGVECISQPNHDVLYDAYRGKLVGALPSAGPNRPTKTTLLHANLQLTRRCNLSCSYCRTSSSPRTDTSDELSTSQWALVFDQLKEDGVRSVFVTGGEIFTRSDIWDLLGEMEQRFIVHILTNGDALSGPITKGQREIVRHLSSVQVSLDSATPEIHDQARGRGSWARAVCSLQVASSLGIDVVISTVLRPEVECNARALAALADRLGAALLLRPLLPQGRGATLDCRTSDPKDFYRQLGRAAFVRGFLAYSEELVSFGISAKILPSIGVIAFNAMGARALCLDS